MRQTCDHIKKHSTMTKQHRAMRFSRLSSPNSLLESSTCRAPLSWRNGGLFWTFGNFPDSPCTHTHISWDVTLCHQASCSWHLEGLWCLQCQRCSSLRPALGLRNRWRWLFSTSQTTCPVAQHHITEDRNPQEIFCSNTHHKMSTYWTHCTGMSTGAYCTWCGIYIAWCLAHLSRPQASLCICILLCFFCSNRTSYIGYLFRMHVGMTWMWSLACWSCSSGGYQTPFWPVSCIHILLKLTKLRTLPRELWLSRNWYWNIVSIIC